MSRESSASATRSCSLKYCRGNDRPTNEENNRRVEGDEEKKGCVTIVNKDICYIVALLHD